MEEIIDRSIADAPTTNQPPQTGKFRFFFLMSFTVFSLIEPKVVGWG